jgi:hypothetical protein
VVVVVPEWVLLPVLPVAQLLLSLVQFILYILAAQQVAVQAVVETD